MEGKHNQPPHPLVLIILSTVGNLAGEGEDSVRAEKVCPWPRAVEGGDGKGAGTESGCLGDDRVNIQG